MARSVLASWQLRRWRPIRSRSASAIYAMPASNRHCRWPHNPPKITAWPARLLAIEDNNTTGKFLNQHFTLTEVRLKESDDVAAAANKLADHDSYVILDLPADEVLKVADTLRDRGTVLFDAGSIDDRCASRTVARTSFMWRRPARCLRTRLRNISCGSSGSAGCWWPARTITTNSTRTRCVDQPRALARKSCRSGLFRIPAAPAAPTAA